MADRLVMVPEHSSAIEEPDVQKAEEEQVLPRNLQRLCLQDGISINLNRLLQRGSLVRNGRTVGATMERRTKQRSSEAIKVASARAEHFLRAVKWH